MGGSWHIDQGGYGRSYCPVCLKNESLFIRDDVDGSVRIMDMIGVDVFNSPPWIGN
jgi:hypothetical protein